MEVVVEGERCGPPACAVHSSKSGSRGLLVDLTQIPNFPEGRACWQLQPVHVDIAVRGVPRVGRDACASVNGACQAVDAWADYDLGCSERADGQCGRRGRLDRNPQRAALAVGTVVVV